MQNITDEELNKLISDNLGNINELNNCITSGLNEQTDNINNIQIKTNNINSVFDYIYNKLYNMSSSFTYLFNFSTNNNTTNATNTDNNLDIHIRENKFEDISNINTSEVFNEDLDILDKINIIKKSSININNILVEQNTILENINNEQDINESKINNNFKLMKKLLYYYS